MVGLTMFHQLHCLGMIRGALQENMGRKEMEMDSSKGKIVAGTDRRRSQDEEELFGVRRKRDVKRRESEEDLFGVRRRKRGDSHAGAPDHYLHCFDYLVQVC